MSNNKKVILGKKLITTEIRTIKVELEVVLEKKIY